MKHLELITAGLIPHADILLKKPKDSAILPLEYTYYFNPENPLLNQVDIHSSSCTHYANNRKYSLLGFHDLSTTLYRLSTKMCFGRIQLLAKQANVLKHFTFLEACLLLQQVLETHIGQKNKRIIVLLKTNSIEQTPYLQLVNTNENKYNLSIGKLYPDFVIRENNIVALKKVKLPKPST